MIHGSRSSTLGFGKLNTEPSVPTADELYKRLLALFDDAGDDDAVTLQSLADQEQVGSEGLVVQLNFTGQEELGTPEDRLDTWLDEPNPAFGDDPPKKYLDGNEQQLDYLAAVIGALEQGAFF